MLRKTVGALLIVMVLQCLLTLFTVSAQQVQVPRNMPFGVTGTSSVVTAAQSAKLEGAEVSFDTITYADESAAMTAINRGEIYGAYITGKNSDTLLAVPQKSFFAFTEVVPIFTGAAKQVGRPLTVQVVKPLPAGDRVGGVVGLLLLPCLVGGLLASILLFKASSSAPQTHRVGYLLGYAVVAGLLTDLIAGPLLGGFSGAHFWPLWPVLAAATAAIALVSAALLAALGALGTILALLLITFLGGAGSGANGASLLPTYWQYIGAPLPPRQVVNLTRNTLYFGGNNITTPIIVLAVYAVAGIVVIWYMGRYRALRASRSAGQQTAPAATVPAASNPAGGNPGHSGGQKTAPDAAAPGRSTPRAILVALGIVTVIGCLYSLNYTSAYHSPVASNLPFGVTGPSSLTTQVQKTTSLKITTYASEAAAKDAIDQAKIWGALIPGTSSSTLIVVTPASALAPLDLETQFTSAAKSQHQKLQVQDYAPLKLPPGDPFGIVLALMLSPLLVGGYISASMLKAATGSTAVRWRGVALIGFAAVAGLLVDLIAGLWLGGFPTSKFWIAWPVLSLIILVVAVFAAVAGRLLGAAGSLVTVLVIMLLGSPSAGGANGVPYLPAFWNGIGPWLPPRNAYILLHNTVYFGGHGITQALTILLVYLAVFGAILAIIDIRATPTPQIPVTPETENEAAAMTVPVGAVA